MSYNLETFLSGVCLIAVFIIVWWLRRDRED
jgi:hypothetical protein